MPRPRKRRRPDPARLEAMVNGEVPLDLAELFDLVRRVNPSRLGCEQAEAVTRYALKARLQSQILRHFASEVRVVPTARPGVVGIRRRYRRGDACHAVVAHLDPDVRALVSALLGGRAE